jgi:hypothetical protein
MLLSPRGPPAPGAAERRRELTRAGEAASGALAGGLTRLLVAPLDVLKIRFQLQRTPVAAAAAAAAGAAASSGAQAAQLVTAAATAGTTAATAAAAAARPLYTSIPQAVRALLREEGARTLWRGNASAMALWVAYMGASFPAYRAAHAFAERELAARAWSTRQEAPPPARAAAAFAAAAPAVAPPSRLSSALALGGSRSAAPAAPAAPATPAHVAPALLPALFAGAVSGFAATLATYPLDWLRTRVAAQGVPRQHATALALVRAVLREEGPRGLFRGLVPTLLQIAPSLAVTFAVYEQAGEAWDAAAAALAAAEAARAAAARAAARIAARAAQAAAAVAVVVPTGAAPLSANLPAPPPPPPLPPDDADANSAADAAADAAAAASASAASAEPSSLRSLAAGALAGTLGKLCVFPLDVVKRRMQAQTQRRDARYGAPRAPYRGTLDALRSIAREEGARGLFKGLTPSLLKAGAAAALTFFVYETAAARLRRVEWFSAEVVAGVES